MGLSTENKVDDVSMDSLMGMVVDSQKKEASALLSIISQVPDNLIPTLFDHIPIMVCHLDTDLRFQYVNRAYRKQTGFDQTELVGIRLKQIIKDHDYRDTKACLVQVFKGEVVQRVETRRYPNMPSCVVDAFYLPTKNDLGKVTGFFAIKRVIKEQSPHEARLSSQTRYDGLTGLKNRSALHDDLKELFLDEGLLNRICFIQLNLRRFGQINTSFGHLVGDEVLQHMANRLSEFAGDSSQVYRLGGDEFAIVYQKQQSDACVTSNIDSLLKLVKRPIQTSCSRVSLNGRLGIVCWTDDITSSAELLRNADIAFRDAIKRDVNFSLYDQDMRRSLLEKIKLESELKLALRSGQVQPWFQPLVDVCSQRVIGYEALARWIRPDNNVVPPSVFIPIADQTGMIIELGDRMVLQSLKALKKLQKLKGLDHAPKYVSVNVSPLQLLSSSYVQRLSKILNALNIAPHCLLLEVTEEIAAADNEQMLSTIKRIKSLGIRIACDDFGAGYSSLSRLWEMPWDCIKIDRSFLQKDENVSLLEPISQMAHKINLPVIVEGVETDLHHQRVLNLGCEIGQGYLYGKPAPIQFADVKSTC